MRLAKAAGTCLLLLAIFGLSSPAGAVELLGPAAVRFAVRPSPEDLAVADFDGDGLVDVAVASRGGYRCEDLVTACTGDAGCAGIGSGSCLASVGVHLGDGRGGFAPVEVIAVGSLPASVVAADFDGNGTADLAVASQGSGTVSFMAGLGTGQLSPATELPGSYEVPSRLAVADFDGDGGADLAVADPVASAVSVLFGRDDGDFDGPLITPGLPFAIAVAAGDFDTDGVVDLAVATLADGSVSTLAGLGDGSFATPSTTDGFLLPIFVAVADFDADGAHDLAVLDGDAASVGVLMGDGSGEFEPPAMIDVGASPRAAAAGDVDGDGAEDLVVVNLDDDSVSILLGDGNGDFVRRCRGDLPDCAEVGVSSPTAVALADLDGNGAPDLAVTNKTSNTLSVLLGDGLGSVVEARGFAVGQAPEAIATAYLNDDDVADLVVANTLDGSLSILLSDRIGGFVPAADTGETFDTPVAVAVGDFNGDGRDDLAVAGLDGIERNVSILLGEGDEERRFVRFRDLDLEDDRPCSLALADFDRDGQLDLVVVHAIVASFEGNRVSVLRGQADGDFVPHASLRVRDDCGAAGVGDFDGDGELDLAVTNIRTDSVRVFPGDGTAGFDAPLDDIPDVGPGPASIAVADLDEDERLDLVVTLSNGESVRRLRGRGDGTFDLLDPVLPVGDTPWSVAVTDVNEDSQPDLVVTNSGSDSVSILLGQGGGSFLRGPDIAVGGQPIGLCLGDFDVDGHDDLAVANRTDGSVTVLSSQIRGRADLNGSNRIDGFDVVEIGRLGGLDTGSPGFRRSADVDLNGTIDGDDLTLVAGRFGELRREAPALRLETEAAAATEPATVTLQPVASEGDLLTVDVVVHDDVHPVAAADFAVTFEPGDSGLGQVLEVAGAKPGDYLSGGFGQFYTADSGDPGRVEIVMSRLPSQEATGSGPQTLIRLFFKARREGSASIGFAPFRRAQPTLLDATADAVAEVPFVGTLDVSVGDDTDLGPPGQKIGFAPESLDFGQVDVATSSRKTLRISNFGFSELGIYQIACTLPEFRSIATCQADGVPPSDPCFTIPPFGFVELAVLFEPTGAASFSGQLVIESDDPRRPDTDGDGLGEVRVPLTGASGAADATAGVNRGP